MNRSEIPHYAYTCPLGLIFNCLCANLDKVYLRGRFNNYESNLYSLMVTEIFNSTWGRRRAINGMPINIDVVYRYMDRIHIKEFFDTGRLKLSSFHSNRIIENPIKNDPDEGFHNFLLLSRDRKSRFQLRAKDLDVRRVLCTSTKPGLENRLGEGCFAITNINLFALEVAKVLNQFKGGCDGLVEYSNAPGTVILLENHLDLPDLSPKSKSPPGVFQYYAYLGEQHFGAFFLKNPIYSLDYEYRFVWHCQGGHDLFIDCPNALNYCEEIN